MFDVPSQYQAETTIEPKTFTPREIKKPVRERILQNIMTAQLTWQIAGEDVPSYIDDDYRCEVIMGIDVKLKNLNDNAFFAEHIQHMVKSPCVIRFYNDSDEIFSFAHKRLSHTDTTQVVILERIETPQLSMTFPDKTAKMLRSYLSYGKLLNITDKLSLYIEAVVKAFIISHPKLYSGVLEWLDRKLWYNRGEVLELFNKLLELQRLNADLQAEKLPGEKAKLMSDIKSKIMDIKENEHGQ